MSRVKMIYANIFKLKLCCLCTLKFKRLLKQWFLYERLFLFWWKYTFAGFLIHAHSRSGLGTCWIRKLEISPSPSPQAFSSKHTHPHSADAYHRFILPLVLGSYPKKGQQDSFFESKQLQKQQKQWPRARVDWRETRCLIVNSLQSMRHSS